MNELGDLSEELAVDTYPDDADVRGLAGAGGRGRGGVLSFVPDAKDMTGVGLGVGSALAEVRMATTAGTAPSEVSAAVFKLEGVLKMMAEVRG